MNNISKDTPYIRRGVQTDYKKLYYSESDAALKVPITVRAGFGILSSGLALALDTSNAGTKKGMAIPLDPTAITGEEYAPGRAYLVAAGANATDVVYVTVEDSYKFEVGDDVIIEDDTTAAENLGAIETIVRGASRATITVTTAIGSTAFTTARFAHIKHEGNTVCVGILEKDVDCGVGDEAYNANASLIYSNATLYAGMTRNIIGNSAQITAMGAKQFGNFFVIK
ncbi:MAG: hypothetical protein GY845_09540 [Planctomycetes bacterium]|nr:hypothetical protein [Planctomycetota bacterium]